jgi:hypothetical protein
MDCLGLYPFPFAELQLRSDPVHKSDLCFRQEDHPFREPDDHRWVRDDAPPQSRLL